MIIGLIIGGAIGYALAAILSVGKINDLYEDNLFLVGELKRLTSDK